MAINSNSGEDNEVRRHGDKYIMRIPSGPDIGAEAPEAKPGDSCSYLWVMAPRRRQEKGWREFPSIN